MMKKVLIGLFSLLILFIAGCEGVNVGQLSDQDLERISEKAVVCNEPYIRFGTSCCLDENSNNICDKDEGGAEIKTEDKTQTATKPTSEKLGNVCAIYEGINDEIPVNEVLAGKYKERMTFIDISNHYWSKFGECQDNNDCITRLKEYGVSNDKITPLLEQNDVSCIPNSKINKLSWDYFDSPSEEITDEDVEIIEEPMMEEEDKAQSSSSDLSDYPNMFLTDGRFNGVIIVGDNSPSMDVVSASEIGKALAEMNIDTGAVKEASDIGNYKSVNTILIGNACNNKIVKSIYGNPTDCKVGLTNGEGVVRLISHSTGTFSLIVEGYGNEDTLLAAKGLVNFKDYDFEGSLVIFKNGDCLNNICLVKFEEGVMTDE